MAERFKVIWCDPTEHGDDGGRECHALVECDAAGNIVRYVAYDGGEPEDQTLGRDFAWVEREMNALADRERGLREALDKTVEALNEREGWLHSDMIMGIFSIAAIHGFVGDGGEWSRQVKAKIEDAIATAATLSPPTPKTGGG